MSDREDQNIEALNELLKGEHMAIHVYNKTKNLQTDNQVKSMLIQFLQDHQRHAEQLRKRIEEMGGIPNADTGFTGMMGSISAMINSIRGPKHLLKQVFDGEDKGIHAYEDRLDHLDQKSKELVKQIMSEDHEHLKLFKARMEEEKSELHE